MTETSETGSVPTPSAGYRPAGTAETVRANRSWWDAAADAYHAEHGDFLGADRFVWCPEGLDEAEAGLLGPTSGRDVLEVGCGGGQCSRWLAAQGARVVGLDQSIGMLRHGLAPATGRPAVPLIRADARALPLRDASFDLACSAYGAVPFVADPWVVMSEVYRVLRHGGRWAFALSHPIRWAFPDEPDARGLTASLSYFDRTPYVEFDPNGTALYAEHHRTLGDRVRDLVGAGFVLDDLVEPEWPDGLERVWGGWSPLRGRLIPGTAIFLARKP